MTRQSLLVTETEAEIVYVLCGGGGAPGKATRLYAEYMFDVVHLLSSVGESTVSVLDPLRGLGACCLDYIIACTNACTYTYHSFFYRWEPESPRL